MTFAIRHSILIGSVILSLIPGPRTSSSAAEHHSSALKVPASGRTYLQLLPPASTGLAFTNFISDERGLENSLLTSGAGVAAGDVDGDGLCDLFLCGTEHSNALFKNLGNWKFTNITKAAGLAMRTTPIQFSSGAAFADVEGDYDLDLLVNFWGGGTRLFLNDGKGHFTEKADSGLLRKYGSTSLALGDVDGNGTLDLYVANYATTKIEDRPNTKFDTKTIDGKIVITAIDGVPTTSPELTNRYFVDSEKVVRELGEPDFLYLGSGDGKFKPLSWTDGTFLDEAGQPLTNAPLDFGLSVMFRDMNGDLAPDIYICNDLFPPDRIWVNDGRGRFRAMSNLAVRNTSRFSMGVDFADIDRDGYDDFFVVDMLSRDHTNRKVQTVGVNPMYLPVGKIDNRPQYKRNTLFLSRSDGTYAEIAQLSGLDATEWSWMPLFLDVDMDGFEDVLVSTGHMRDSLNADAVGEIVKRRSGRRLLDSEHRALKKQFYPVLNTPLQAFRNRGDLTFEDKAKEWGIDYAGITQAMCLADFDNDGDADLVVVPINHSVLVYENQTTAPRVTVRLKGKSPNTYGVGAKIKLYGGAVAVQQQEMLSGGRYLGSDDLFRSFPARKSTNGMRIEVTWRSGETSVVSNVQPNHLYLIDEALAERGQPVPASARAPLFEDVSHLINHRHTDEPFFDFEQQPLLGKRLSQLGPGITWHDVDRDGWDDLLIGSGVGGRLALYRNSGKGGFEPVISPPFDKPVTRDQTSILPISDSQLLIGSSNYEDAAPTGGCAVVVSVGHSNNANHPELPPWEASTGPLAMGDWSGDGLLDLFVGGRTMPGKYPDEPFSLLLRGTKAGFELDEQATRLVARAGMVSGAVFSDLNNDGLPELLLACEWGPIRLLRNNKGLLEPWNPPVKTLNAQPPPLNQLTGWWNGITTGDFDGDGWLDIVASNWGRNSKYQNYRQQPLRIAYGDWRSDGSIDSMEVYFDHATKKLVPWCTIAAARKIPFIAERFPTDQSFGVASMRDILGEKIKSTRVLEATWLDTAVFMNRGDHFEVKPLPIEAQFSPAFGVNVADMDGDGDEDIFLSQNFFAVDGDTSRYDAGRGLWLEGDGHGGFKAVSGQVSGITVYGEQRGSAICDYDGDGRVDLVVSQNGAETKLYRNTKAKPGLRVRLAGPPENPRGVGAMLRLRTADVPVRSSPSRFIHCGSGYWSHDSVVQVFARADTTLNHLEIRWPGGKSTTVKVPSDAREISVDSNGQLKVLR